MTQMSTYYAHSAQGLPERDWQPLADHLKAVGRLAADKASHFGASEMAEVAGLLHDLGKYCEEFQERLRGSTKKVDHATWGARIALDRYQSIGKLLSYAIAGHHAGLADGRDDMNNRITPLENRLKRESETSLDSRWESEVSLPQEIGLPPFKPRSGQQYFQLAFLGRMIFSCLVDADFLDTETFYNRIENKIARRAPRGRVD